MQAADLPYTVRNLALSSGSMVAVPTQSKFIRQLFDAMTYFFGRSDGTYSDHFPTSEESPNFPFKGFILAGPPGSGKTEAVIESGRMLYKVLAQEGAEVQLFHVNSANINRKGLGDNEARLRQVFRDGKSQTDKSKRTIILFDDIETLLVKRTDEHTSEWGRSMNGVFFHELDQLITTRTMVIATTNEPNLVDDAVTSRLTLRDAPAPTIEEMVEVSKTCIPIAGANGMTREQLQEKCAALIQSQIDEGEPPSFRLARKSAIEILMSDVVGWNN